jgi:hypothetical protein
MQIMSSHNQPISPSRIQASIADTCYWTAAGRMVRILLISVIVGTAMAGKTNQVAQADERRGQPVVVIQKMLGTGTVVRLGKSVPAQPKLVLQVGDTVTTAANSSIVITFADGSAHTLLQNSSVTIEDVVSFSENDGFSFSAALKMARGKARFYFKPRESRRHSSVRTHNATLGVRGTRFLVDNMDLQSTHVVVFSGQVAAANNREPEKTVPINPGQYGRIRGTETPEQPRMLTERQLASVLGEEDTNPDFFEEDPEHDVSEDDHQPTFELGAGVRAALASDFPQTNLHDNEEVGGGPAFLTTWLTPLAGTTIGLSFAALEFDHSNLRTVTLGAHLGFRRTPFRWLAWGASVGLALRRLEPLEPERPAESAEPSKPQWDPDQDWAVVEGSLFARLPASSLVGVLISLHTPRMIHPERWTTVEAMLGLTLAL